MHINAQKKMQKQLYMYIVLWLKLKYVQGDVTERVVICFYYKDNGYTTRYCSDTFEVRYFL